VLHPHSQSNHGFARGLAHCLFSVFARTFFVIAAASALLVSQTHAVPLYVATTGSDAGNCQTIGTPCLTVSYALTQAAASGDTINIAAGTFVEELTINKSVTLTGAGANSTIIKAPAALTVNAAVPPGSGGQATTIVFVTGATTTVTMQTLHVQGPGTTTCGSIGYGVFVGGGATLNYLNSRVTLTRDLAPPLSGCQNGTGIRFGAAATSQVGSGSVQNSTVETFQKNGITVDNVGSNAAISGNTIIGEVPPPGIAQNGIQVSRGATATITNNTVRNEQCGAASCGPAFNQESATAILLFNPGNTTISSNTLTNSDYGIILSNDALSTATINVTNNTISNNRYGGVLASGGTLNLTGNTISGGAYGVVAASYSDAVQSALINLAGGNIITGATTAGITVYDENIADAFTSTVQGSNNQFINNAVAAANVPPQGAVNLSCNWWGSAQGPANPANPLGNGNPATVNTTFTNWSTDNVAFTCNGNPTTNEALANRPIPTLPMVWLLLMVAAFAVAARSRLW
jgi:Right handed beta helix region